MPRTEPYIGGTAAIVEMLLQKRRRRDSSPDCTAGHVVNGQRDRAESERKYRGGYEVEAWEVDSFLIRNDKSLSESPK
ncbi:hypothetical protein ABER23_04040 [Paenibacillus lautus]